MNKGAVKRTMLALSKAELESARKHYEEYLSSARLDRSEPIDADEQSHAEFASDLAEAFDHQEHAYEAKIERLGNLNFGPKNAVEPGAIVKVAGRYFVVAVSTAKFECEGQTLMGISPEAPIYQAMEGKQVGDECEFRGRRLKVEKVL